MTTNQTIDGVPREHLAAWAERLERAESGFPGSVPFLKELRALLDAPMCKTCNDSGHVSDGEIDCFADGTPYENGPVACIKDCPDCTPAAQPQGELMPFGWWRIPKGLPLQGMFLHYDPVHGERDIQNALDFGFTVKRLYAEQPAPVAVQMCDCNQGRLPCNGGCNPCPANDK